MAEVNLTEGTGKIRYVNPVSRALSAATGGGDFELRMLDATGQALGSYPAPVKLNSCADPSEDRLGIVDALIPANPAARQIELLYNGQVFDTFRSGGGAPRSRTYARKRLVNRLSRSRGTVPPLKWKRRISHITCR